MVSLVRCGGYEPAEVERSVREMVGLLGGMGSFVSPGAVTLIKPNMLAAKPPDKAVTTHPEIVRAVVRLVREAGGIPRIGDSQAMGSFSRVADVSGIAKVAEEEGAEQVELKDAVRLDGGGTFRHFEVASQVVEADVVINLPKAKTHGQMLLTLAVKNLFGCIPGRRKAQWHLKSGVDREAFATMLVELAGIVRPALSIVDAVVGMEGNGPGSGDPRRIGLVVAGTNPFAVDMALCGVLGVSPDRLPTHKVAVKRGLVPGRIENIRLAGDFRSVDEARVMGFRLPTASSVEWGIPEPVRKALKEALTTKPRVDKKKCELCLMCKEMCPARAMSSRDGAISINYRECIRCFCCQEVCPVGAIDVVEGWLLKYLG